MKLLTIEDRKHKKKIESYIKDAKWEIDFWIKELNDYFYMSDSDFEFYMRIYMLNNNFHTYMTSGMENCLNGHRRKRDAIITFYEKKDPSIKMHSSENWRDNIVREVEITVGELAKHF